MCSFPRISADSRGPGHRAQFSNPPALPNLAALAAESTERNEEEQLNEPNEPIQAEIGRDGRLVAMADACACHQTMIATAFSCSPITVHTG
jgi:hypothetical protein